MELLELICKFLLDPLYGITYSWRMWSFRLTCREINAKTYNFYARAAFQRLWIHLDYRGLQKLTEISQWTPFASKVELLHLSNYDRAIEYYEQYQTAQTEANSETLPRRQHRDAEAQLFRANREQDDKAFVERSATDGILLTLALLKIPHVRKVVFDCVDLREDRLSIRHRQTGHGASTTHTFSVILSSMAHARLKPHELRAVYFGCYNDVQGVSLQALSMPRDVLECISDLRHLELRLETKDDLFKSRSDTACLLGNY